MSTPAVHPVEAPPVIAAAPRLRLKNIQGMPGTPGSLVLRLCQFIFAAISLSVMVTTSDFPSVTAFWIPIWRSAAFLVFASNLMGQIGCGLPFFYISKYLIASYLVAAVGLQSLWSPLLAITDIYALLVKRTFRNTMAVSIFTIGDGITSTVTFAAACASAGITVLIGNDFHYCDRNPCSRFMAATAMAFLSWLDKNWLKKSIVYKIDDSAEVLRVE